MIVSEPITLYSTGCPKCCVLTKKLIDKNIPFKESMDIDTMEAMGIQSVPVLSVGDKLLDFTEAVQWINSYEGD